MTQLNVSSTPYGSFCHSRVHFGRFQTDGGVRTHSTVVGFLLSLIGKATALQ